MIDIKIDTKEKFSVLTPLNPVLTANMTVDLESTILPFLNKDNPHIVLNLCNVNNVDEEGANFLAHLQQKFYEHNTSFVICCMQTQVEKLLDEKELLEIMNITPSESEAWDIVQMEEIERELLGDE